VPVAHRREYGPQAYHYSRRNFNAIHGSDDQLLARTLELLPQIDDMLKEKAPGA
jgi:hypothetical protein